MTDRNREQIDYWNSAGAKRWVVQQERIDRSFVPLDGPALERAAVQPGERVFDLGCGCGASTLALAERVGPSGSVRGIDVSAPMLERARERAARCPWVSFEQADAATYQFTGADADLVYSRFGLMFFDDPENAFANLRHALRASGRLCFVSWRSPADNPWHRVPFEAAARVLGPPPPTPPDAPSPFALAAPDRVQAILTRAGFREIELHPHDAELEFSTEGMDEALEFAIDAGPVARRLENADAAARSAVRAELARTLAPYANGKRVALHAGVWIVRARP